MFDVIVDADDGLPWATKHDRLRSNLNAIHILQGNALTSNQLIRLIAVFPHIVGLRAEEKDRVHIIASSVRASVNNENMEKTPRKV